MDDLEIDRALHTALSVEPSPEFVARVRTTIADGPRPSILAGWLKPAVAVACAASLAIAMGLPRGEVRQKQDAQLKLSPTERVLSSADEVPAPVVVVPTLSPAVAVAEAGRSAKSATPAARPQVANTEEPLPEVIIAEKDVEALRQFMRSLNDLQFVASFDPTPAPVPWAMTELNATPFESQSAHNN